MEALTGCRPDNPVFAVFRGSRLERIHLATSSTQVECCSEATALQTDDRARRLGCHLRTDEGSI